MLTSSIHINSYGMAVLIIYNVDANEDMMSILHTHNTVLNTDCIQENRVEKLEFLPY